MQTWRSLPILCLLLLPDLLFAADWACWRGPGVRGVSPEKNLPSQWSVESGEQVAFAIDVLPWGNSSPVVVGGRVYLTSQTEDKRLHVIALDGDGGREVWSREVGGGTARQVHRRHNMATPTPVAEGDRVWALFGTGDLVCLSREGEPLWRRSLTEDLGEYKILWGMATSPILFKDCIFIACMHAGPSYVLAVDKLTGKDLWKKDRDLPCVGEATDSYSTPILVRVKERTELVVAGADHVNAYDPKTGEQLWISSGLKIEHKYGRSIVSPTSGDGYVVASSSNFSNLGRTIALRAGGSGDVTKTHRVWTYDKASPDCPTPVIYQGYVYMVRDDGIGTCVELASGQVKWTKRLFRGDAKASPIAGDGKVYFFSLEGECLVLEAGPEGKTVARNRVDGAGLVATPAISGGKLWIRTKKKLYAIGRKS